MLGPFIVLVPRKSHLVTNRVGKVLVDIAHHRWTRYITFCLYATVIVANVITLSSITPVLCATILLHRFVSLFFSLAQIICIYSIYVLFTDIMGLSVTDALGVGITLFSRYTSLAHKYSRTHTRTPLVFFLALLYGFLNIVYVASFYPTMFRHPIVIRGTDLFKTLRSSLYTDKPISREEVFELPERTRRRVIQSDDGTFVLRAYWLHSWQFLYAYICVFSALMLVTIGTAVWYFIVDMNNFKSLNESSAAFALCTTPTDLYNILYSADLFDVFFFFAFLSFFFSFSSCLCIFLSLLLPSASLSRCSSLCIISLFFSLSLCFSLFLLLSSKSFLQLSYSLCSLLRLSLPVSSSFSTRHFTHANDLTMNRKVPLCGKHRSQRKTHCASCRMKSHAAWLRPRKSTYYTAHAKQRHTHSL